MSTMPRRLCDSVIYQIYPRSFQDSDGDGVGDLNGITSKLDYLEWLGVNGIWLSPVFLSPMADFGYDVADYCRIDPLYGTMKDFERLLRESHLRGIKVLLDFVPNHTSEKHAWFKNASASLTSEKRDWYVWHDPKPDGSPPNNWLSVFGGPAWQLDKKSGQYYLHTFLKQQPDLNWANPSVRGAMKDVLRFWLDKGVDGFRFDAVYGLAKDESFRDDPIYEDYLPGHDNPYDSLRHTRSGKQPAMYDYLKELTGVVASYDNRFIVTEAYPEKRFHLTGYLDFYKNIDPQHLAPFNFEGLHLPWDARQYKQYIDAFQESLRSDYCPVYVTGNHDSPRIASRIGYRAAKSAAMILLTLPGMPFIYYGDEIGMENVPIKKRQVHDPFEMNVPHRGKGRDPERTPMQWTPARNAGFSRVTPWLPIGRNYRQRDVQTESAGPASMLSLYRRLLHLRRASSTLRYGRYISVSSTHPDIYAFIRKYEDEKLAVVVNFSHKKQHPVPFDGHTIISTHGNIADNASLRPYEGRIIRLPS